MLNGSPYASAGYTLLKFEPHLHTVHSDGQDTIEAMFTACKSAGYQAVALTDHNTVSGLDEAAVVARRLGLIFVPGVEVTTFHGHAVVLGITRMPEWRNLEQRGMDAMAAEVHAEGGVLSVAHPAALGSPVCSGCAWDWPIEAGSVDLWEIMNSARLEVDVPSRLWQQLLARGGACAPAGAGDVHSTAAASAARPATYVFVHEASADGVLEALRARRAFASMGSPLEFWLEHADGRIALSGERVDGDGWTPRTLPAAAAEVERVPCAGGRCAVYARRLDADGSLEAVSAPIWMSISQ
jgi:PHP domain